MELEFEGAKVRRTAFHRSLIRSDERLDYPRVDRIFEGERADGPWAPSLAAARQVARRWPGARAGERWPSNPVEPEFGFSPMGTSERSYRPADRVAPLIES